MALKTTSVINKPTQTGPSASQGAADPYEEGGAEGRHEDEQESPVADSPVVPAKSTAPVPLAGAFSDMEDDGFGDLDKDLGYGSFPMIKLDGSTFESTEGHSMKHLDVVIQLTREKVFIKARKGNDSDIPMTYAYLPAGSTESVSLADVMGLTAADGTAVADHIAQWREEGELEEKAAPVMSVYREVLVTVFNTGTSLDGEPAILNVAPSSRCKLAGYRRKLQWKKKSLKQVLTRVCPGPKITVGKNSYHPWAFEYNGDLPEEM